MSCYRCAAPLLLCPSTPKSSFTSSLPRVSPLRFICLPAALPFLLHLLFHFTFSLSFSFFCLFMLFFLLSFFPFPSLFSFFPSTTFTHVCSFSFFFPLSFHLLALLLFLFHFQNFINPTFSPFCLSPSSITFLKLNV